MTGGGALGPRLAALWYQPAPDWKTRALLGGLAPAAWLFAAAADLRGLAFDRGLARALRAPLPVISVGGLTVGGAGKTPVALEIVRRLRARGLRPAVLSRGYGARDKAARVVSEGGGLRLDPADAGDEPALFARRAPGACVLAGPDRHALALRAQRMGASVAVLDDGLQHRRLHRDLEVVVIDAAAGLGNGRRLPRGPLRENPGALFRADLVWFTRQDQARGRPPGLPDLPPGLPVVRSRYRPAALTDAAGHLLGAPESLRGRPVVALAGLANPRSFVTTLEGLGADVVAARFFPDHHPYRPAELAAVREEAARLGAAVITTEKDALRMGEAAGGIQVLTIDLEIVEGADALSRLLADLPFAATPG